MENIFFRGGATARPAATTNIIIQLDELDEILDGGGEEITLRLTNGAEISGAKLVESAWPNADSSRSSIPMRDR